MDNQCHMYFALTLLLALCLNSGCDNKGNDTVRKTGQVQAAEGILPDAIEALPDASESHINQMGPLINPHFHTDIV